jgi:hypothetical protein
MKTKCSNKWEVELARAVAQEIPRILVTIPNVPKIVYFSWNVFFLICSVVFKVERKCPTHYHSFIGK